MTPSGEVLSELKQLKNLTARAGSDPLLTQASTGNSSAKLGGQMWIKASGAWMADATHEDIFISLELAHVRECLRRNVDPADVFPRASLETAMHAVLPQRFVLHIHSVDAIAWAVRLDAAAPLESRIGELRWRWIPYVASGLPLAREIERAMEKGDDANVFILGNHGLILAANKAGALESLLQDVLRRLAIRPRTAPRPDYSLLAAVCENSRWAIPEDDDVHALATDADSRAILRGGFLYPCQAMFPGASSPEAPIALFQPVARGSAESAECVHRPFLLIEDAGVVVNRTARPAEVAILLGLAQVVLRLRASAPIRYLTAEEVAALCCPVAVRYMESANAHSPNVPDAAHAFGATARVKSDDIRSARAGV